jgi:hypothetical protein
MLYVASAIFLPLLLEENIFEKDISPRQIFAIISSCQTTRKVGWWGLFMVGDTI